MSEVSERLQPGYCQTPPPVRTPRRPAEKEDPLLAGVMLLSALCHGAGIHLSRPTRKGNGH